jgi:hypothetical protein
MPAATTSLKSPECKRPAPSSLSTNVARPSICQSGSDRFGNASTVRPKIAFAARAHPRDRSRWQMCAYSCVKTYSSQLSVFPISSRPVGGVASIRIAFHGTTVALPFALSFWSARMM